MELDKLCQCSREGWLWAPEETLEEFLRRKNNFRVVAFPQKNPISSSLFDIHAQEICLIEDNASLWPWQGAVLWEYEEEGIKYPVIQIRKSLSKLWKRFYTQQEMMEHELVHAVRFAYKEPFFEETLAYQTSSKKWRKFLGPLFMYPWEASFVLFVCLAAFLGAFFQESFLGIWILSALLGVFFLRLLVLQGLFALCKMKLKKIGLIPSYVLPVMLRLSDKEIVKTALRSSVNNRKYFQSQSKQMSRLSILTNLYFNKAEEKQVYF